METRPRGSLHDQEGGARLDVPEPITFPPTPEELQQPIFNLEGFDGRRSVEELRKLRAMLTRAIAWIAART